MSDQPEFRSGTTEGPEFDEWWAQFGPTVAASGQPEMVAIAAWSASNHRARLQVAQAHQLEIDALKAEHADDMRCIEESATFTAAIMSGDRDEAQEAAAQWRDRLAALLVERDESVKAFTELRATVDALRGQLATAHDALTWADRQLGYLMTEDDGDGAFVRGGGIEFAGFGAGRKRLREAIKATTPK